MPQYPGWDSNPQAPGFKPGRSAVGVPGPFEAEAVGLEPTSGYDAATCFQDRPLIRPDGFREGLNSSSGGWNRTSGLRVQSAASLPPATAPDSGRRRGFEIQLPPPDSKSGSLPVSRFPRAPPRESNPPVGPGKPAPDRSARDASTVASSAGSGIRTPIAWLEARSRALGPIPRLAGGRRGSRTLKAHRSPGFEPGAVALRLALPYRRAPAAGIEPASPRLTAGRSYQHELHRNCRVRQSGWPDSNRRFPAPKAGGLARLSYIPSRLVHRQVPSGSRTRTSAMARR